MEIGKLRDRPFKSEAYVQIQALSCTKELTSAQAANDIFPIIYTVSTYYFYIDGKPKISAFQLLVYGACKDLCSYS